jgi:hypothetical protein
MRPPSVVLTGFVCSYLSFPQPSHKNIGLNTELAEEIFNNDGVPVRKSTRIGHSTSKQEKVGRRDADCDVVRRIGEPSLEIGAVCKGVFAEVYTHARTPSIWTLSSGIPDDVTRSEWCGSTGGVQKRWRT